MESPQPEPGGLLLVIFNTVSFFALLKSILVKSTDYCVNDDRE